MAVKASASITVALERDISGVWRFYKVAASTSTPSAPTEAQGKAYINSGTAISGWSTAEPAYDGTSTNSLYSCDLTGFTDGTVSWSAVSKSSSYEAAKQAYNLANTANGNATTALEQSVEYIVGTQTAATNTWTGVTKDASIKAGKTIAYYLPFAGNSSAATLNLTLAGGGTTGAKIIRINNSNVTTHYPQYSIIKMTYDGTYWKTDNYNSDTYNRTRMQNVICAAAAITAGHIICGTASGYKNIAASVAFDLAYPLLYAGSALAAAATGDNNYLQINSINVTNNGTVTSAANYKTVYLKGTISGNTFTIAASPFMTTVTPTSEDGFCYIPLGVFYNSTTNIYFISSSQVYKYKDGAFGPVSIREASAAAKTATNYITDVTNGITIHPVNDANSDYARIDANGLTVYKGGNDVASFGDTARVGKSNSSRFVMNAASLQAYDGSNNKYFEVSSSGLTFGSNTAATTTALENEVNARKAIYGTCGTAAGTQAKGVTCANFALYTGASVTVGFTNANTHATPTLNVNSTGAKSIKSYTGVALTEAEYKWAAGAALTFVYDGTYWRMQDSGATESKAAAAASASAAATSATTATNKASAASTSATNAASSASTASDKASAASTSATNAANSASAAATSASTASTKATAASTSATNAANSASAASTSATNASNSASAASTSATNAANSASTALDTVTVKDTRNDNQNPQWYITNYPKKRVQEFKQTTKIGLTGDTYCWLQTDVPWGDSSGGWPKQTTEVNGKQYWRQGASGTAWSAWVDAYGTALESAKTATTYITDIDSNLGITIKPKTSTGNDYLQINSSAISMYRNNVEMMRLEDSALKFKNSSGQQVATFGSSISLGKNLGDLTLPYMVISNTGIYWGWADYVAVAITADTNTDISYLEAGEGFVFKMHGSTVDPFTLDFMNDEVYAETMHINGKKIRSYNLEGSSWVAQRSYASFARISTPTDTGMYPLLDAKTPSGDWAICTYGENLHFSYVTDSNFNAGTNTHAACTVYSNGDFGFGSPNTTFAVTSVTITNSKLAAHAGEEKSATSTKSGWFPICIAGWNGGSRHVMLSDCYLSSRASGSATVKAYFTNTNDSALGNTSSFVIYILWCRIGG